MHYRQIGDVPRKRHTVHRSADGRRYFEELVGTEGFSASSSLLYHRGSPSAVLSIEAVDDPHRRAVASLIDLDPARPLHLRTAAVALAAPDGRGEGTDRVLLAGNEDVLLSRLALAASGSLMRNASADELVFLRTGGAVLETSFGALPVSDSDYVVIPRGVTHRWVIGAGPLDGIVLETAGHLAPPARYLSGTGQFLEHSPYCERDIRAPDEVPALSPDTRDGAVEVIVRSRRGTTAHRHVHHPFDVVGWDGGLYPWALSIRDFEPIVGSLHQPPPVHQTFAAPGVVVCSFVPRPFDFRPDAIKVPYHHSNVDSDEVLYYAGGDFMSRGDSGVGLGSMTLHPAGFVHGPQPGSWERSIEQSRTEETAVMIDTFRPLKVTPAALVAEDPAYLTSWAR